MPTNDRPEFLTRADVAAHLEIPLKTLTWWVVALRPRRRYDTFHISRQSGDEPRVIDAPIKPIKDLQRRLVKTLESTYVPPVHVHGFVRDRGPVSNATIHRRQAWVLRVDIADFFPAIHFGRVRGLFQAFPFDYPEDVATLLAQICCHEGRLPQGAPSSPIISNLICRGMDKELAQLAAAERCFYTRYADDLCFSTDRTVFPESLASTRGGESSVGSDIEGIVKGNGFAVNRRKTRLTRRTQRQRVTGLIVNEKVNVDREYLRSLRNLIYIWNTHGIEVAKEAFSKFERVDNQPPGKPDATFELRVRGRVQRVGEIKGWDSPAYRALAEGLEKADPSFKPRVRHSLPGPSQEVVEVHLFTEGKSDVIHLEAAQAYFNAQTRYEEFQLSSDESSPRGNDEKLLKHAEALVVSPPAETSVCLLDTDTERARKALGGKAWLKLGPSVFLVGLVPPSWLPADEPVCVELLHTTGVLGTRDGDGRRVYLRSEFTKKSGEHETESCVIPNPANRSLVQEVVYELRTERSIGLSKMAFAEYVSAGKPPYDSIDFRGFEGTFQSIREAVHSG